MQDIIQQYLVQNWWPLSILIIWTLIWKGIALWKAARNESKTWFVIMLIVNTVGILEIIYIFAIAGRKKVSAQN